MTIGDKMPIIKPLCPKCRRKSNVIYVEGRLTRDGIRRTYSCKSCGSQFTPSLKTRKEVREIFANKELDAMIEKSMPCRNWNEYNLVQTKEKFWAMKIISDAVDSMRIPYCYRGTGRPHADHADMIKACCIKVFCNFSCRRSMPELVVAKSLGYLDTIPSFNPINRYMKMEFMTPYFESLYKILSLPLTEIEQNFAPDSTGFSTFGRRKWFDVRFDHKMRRDYVKLHVMSGVRTNIITAARITKGTAADSPLFEDLTFETAERFKMNEILADAGYLSKGNCEIAVEVGARPYILPKSNVRRYNIPVRRDNQAWIAMIRAFTNNKHLFLDHYHQRSNVESTFSMMKRKFLPYLRSKSFTGQKNELLCKVVCHNASVLCNAMVSLNVKLDFDKSNGSA